MVKLENHLLYIEVSMRGKRRSRVFNKRERGATGEI